MIYTARTLKNVTPTKPSHSPPCVIILERDVIGEVIKRRIVIIYLVYIII